jgi:hypothetical protein
MTGQSLLCCRWEAVPEMHLIPHHNCARPMMANLNGAARVRNQAGYTSGFQGFDF